MLLFRETLGSLQRGIQTNRPVGCMCVRNGKEKKGYKATSRMTYARLKYLTAGSLCLVAS